MTDFQEKVYQETKKIPRGKVSTYKLVAKAAGRPRAYRAVGNILHVNSYPYYRKGVPPAKLVPCHRVVKSDGSLGGFGGGTRKKVLLLAKEGVKVKDGKIVEFKSRIFTN